MAEVTGTEAANPTCISGMTNGLSLNLQYREDGHVNLLTTPSTDKTIDIGESPPFKELTISTEAGDCNWNVYATKKPLSSFHTHSRPPIVDSDSTKRLLRVGNQLYFLDKHKEDGTFETFVPTKFSLSLDEVARQGRFLIVTSRQKVTDVPVVERDLSASATKGDRVEKKASSSADSGTEVDKNDSNKPVVESEATESETKSEMKGTESENNRSESETKSGDDKKADSDSEPEPEDDPYEISNSEDELSAYESWSEGSTDLEEIGVRTIQDLRPEIPPLELDLRKASRTKNADLTDDTSSDEDLDSEKSCSCCHDSDSDNSVMDDDNQRFASQANNNEDEVWGMIDKIYSDDRDGPASDSEDDADDEMWRGAYAESGWALFGDEDDFDRDFKQFDDDSDDCSECGDEGGACAMLPPNKKPKADKEEESETTELPLGMPTAQIHVYDTSIPEEDDDRKPNFKRLFHYGGMVVNPLISSPPAVHPSKSLLVWPLGDSKIMLADYKRNTYFMKRLRLSRLFSRHVSVNCRFSPDGEYLHIMALEQHRRPPLRLKQMLKLKKGEKEKKKEKEVPVYDLVLSTYRLSKRKTVRAVPFLIHQTKHALGPLEEKYALPTYAWTDKSVFVARAASDRQAKISEIRLFRPSSKDANLDVKVTVIEVETDLGGMQIYLSMDADVSSAELRGEHLLLKSVLQVRPLYKPEEAKKGEKSNEEVVEKARESDGSAEAVVPSTSVEVVN